MAKATPAKKAPSKVLENDVVDTAVKKKRKAQSTCETSPPKKSKLINDGYCVFVGNLNNSKTIQEVTTSLSKYFMTQSVIVQDMRLAKSRKHAFLDLASNIDLTKALSLDGAMILGQPITIAKAKAKTVDLKKKAKAPQSDTQAKDTRCLFLKNVPYNATRRDIREVFPKAIKIRFPDDADSPNRGIAFLEFKNEAFASKMRKSKQGSKIQDRLLIIDSVSIASKHNKNVKTKPANKVEVPPNTTLFVSNLPFTVEEMNIKKVFKKAVTITVPKKYGKSKGYAFVEFATVADAQQAVKATKNATFLKRPMRVQFCKIRKRPQIVEAESKTLIIQGLSDETTTEILQGAFEGCISARIATDKATGKSKGFGFVAYDNEEMCEAAKEAMEDSEINGSKVTVCYLRSKLKKGKQGTNELGGKRKGQGFGAVKTLRGKRKLIK